MIYDLYYLNHINPHEKMLKDMIKNFTREKAILAEVNKGKEFKVTRLDRFKDAAIYNDIQGELLRTGHNAEIAIFAEEFGKENYY